MATLLTTPGAVVGAGVETPTLHLLGGPYVSHSGCEQQVPEGSKRLLAYVALHGRRVERKCAAGVLWPTGDDVRAAGNLRSALWRLRGAGIDMIAAEKAWLALDDHVVVDVELASGWADRVISGTADTVDLRLPCWWASALELLPGWYDDWVLMERERLRQRVLHALEALSRLLARAGRCAEAVEAAVVAVGVDPLRAGAQRALIEAHMVEGNWAEGRRSYEAYRRVLDRELGVEPSPDLKRLLFAVPCQLAGTFS